MRLSRQQQEVLTNALAWSECSPTAQDIADFFGHVDRGLPIHLVAASELFMGWIAHYSNPYAWIQDWEAGRTKNPPITPPAAWIYQAYFSDGIGWCGWVNLLLDFIHDTFVPEYGKTWDRTRPAFEVAYKMAAYHHGRLPAKEMLRR